MKTLWHHKCRRGIICFLGLEIEMCPYCETTQEKAKKPWTEDTPRAKRPVPSGKEEEDD